MSEQDGSRRSAGGALDQVQRLLTLVPWLHAAGEVSVDAAAERLGTTRAQVIKDLKVLLMVGLPGGYPDDLIDVDLEAIEGPDAEGVVRVSNADYLGRPLQLTDTEATALMVALRAVRSSVDPETVAVVDRALAKLEVAVAGAVPAVPVEVSADEDAGIAAHRALLAEGVAAGRQVRMTYYVPARDEESERVVDPHRLVREAGHDYLDAWCHSAEAPRLFRLDRIQGAELLETPVVHAPTVPGEPSAGLFRIAEDALRARLRLWPEAFWVTEYYPVEWTAEGPDGTVETELKVADPRWLRQLLLRLAPHAVLLSPGDLAEDLHLEAGRALRHYRDPAYDGGESSHT